MAVLGVDHLNIRTPNLKSTLDFLRDALGMRVSPVPPRDSTDKGAWVYDDSGAPVLHLASADVRYSPTEVLPTDAPRGSGAIHHVAFSCSDFEAMKERLMRLGVSFRENHNRDTGVRQIFVREPTDILIELNFGAG
jgi:catechol 2,3-dioxygenase-like lactoylglutathione lyase family enzyme